MAASRVLDRVGLVLGGRYRLVAPIGTGASASVYLADDVNLRRRVAVKVLHDALADDEAFLRRFRAEAQAAAALNHPNILAVHDWGQDEGVPFLVTEYLGGGSLRAMLDLGRVLTPAQALLVGLETARGLEYAHRRGFVHRDIKPANLLFDDEGRLRIADFGLARALAEAAWTEPMGAVLGTARYASPEQARGESLDGRSDVYSLALVVVEAVTGQVPFQADTTIGTLMARVDTPIPVPEALGAMRPVLEAAGTPDPALRPDAAEFGNALLQAARAFDRPAPLPLAGTRLPADQLADPDPTEPVPMAGVAAATAAVAVAGGAGAATLGAPTATGGATALGAPPATDPAPGPAPADPGPLGADSTSIRRQAGAVVDHGDPAANPTVGAPNGTDGAPNPYVDRASAADRARGVTLGGPTSVAVTAPDPSVEIADVNASDAARAAEPTTRAARRADRRLAKAEAKAGAARAKAAAKAERAAAGRRRRWPRIVAAVVVVLAVAAAALAGWWYLVRVPTWAVPAYTGRNATELVAIPADHQWTVRRTEQFADGTEPGRILAQDPAAGTELARGGTLAVTVSLGPPPVAVPTDLTGKPLPDATNELTAAGLTVGGVERRFDESAPADQVLAVADGTATELPKGSGVGLVVSAGPEPRTIPDGLVGRSSDQVTSQLRALGLEPATTEEFSETVPKGTVLAVKPETGAQVPKGGAVQVTVSKGPPTVTVPNVAGLSVVDAGAKLEAAGLVVSGTQGSPTKPATGTNPAAGQVVRKGTSVAIVTG